MDNFLLIEDFSPFRDLAINELNNKGFKNFIAPNNIIECQDLLNNHSFKGAIIDFDLKEWVGTNNLNPIRLGNVNCFDGIQLTKQIVSRKSIPHIGLYSSHEQELIKNLKEENFDWHVQHLSRGKLKAHESTKFLPNFVDQFYQLEVRIKQLSKNITEAPPFIQSYLSKKILRSINMGDYVWKAGHHLWLAGVNRPINEEYSSIIKKSNYVWNNPERKYQINLSKDDFKIAELIDITSDNSLTTEMLLDNFNNTNIRYDVLSKKNCVFEYFITQIACEQFVKENISLEKLNNILQQLSPMARFESQKMLFKQIEKLQSVDVKSKEDIYEILRPFPKLGYPKILDIYNGRVDKISGKIAHIKLESLSPEKIVRSTKFNIDLLNQYCLEEDSQFEYTIYQPDISGQASHFEPL